MMQAGRAAGDRCRWLYLFFTRAWLSSPQSHRRAENSLRHRKNRITPKRGHPAGESIVPAASRAALLFSYLCPLRAIALLVLCILAPGSALADILVAQQGLAGAGGSSIQRYSDAGALLWSSPVILPPGAVDVAGPAVGLTLSANGATALATVLTAQGGALLVLDATSGAVTGSIAAASFGGRFTGPTPILAAADGTYWLAQGGAAGSGLGLLFHLGADFVRLGVTAALPGLGVLPLQGLALTPDGDPLLGQGGSIALFQAADLLAAPVALPGPLGLGGGLLRGLVWSGDGLIVAVAGGGDPAAPGIDALLRYTRGPGGAWNAPRILAAPQGWGDAGFDLLAIDPAGNLWVAGGGSDGIAIFNAAGSRLRTPMAGLSEPGSLLYIPMPEPSSLALLGVGLAALILRRLLARI
jgi:hypothetical protein